MPQARLFWWKLAITHRVLLTLVSNQHSALLLVAKIRCSFQLYLSRLTFKVYLFELRWCMKHPNKGNLHKKQMTTAVTQNTSNWKSATIDRKRVRALADNPTWSVFLRQDKLSIFVLTFSFYPEIIASKVKCELCSTDNMRSTSFVFLIAVDLGN